MNPSDRPRHTRSSLDELLRQLLTLVKGSAADEAVEGELDRVLEEIAEEVASRPLEAAYEEVFVSAVRIGGRVIHGTPFMFVTVTGLSADGDPEPLAYLSGYVNARHLVMRLFWDLRRRGIEDVSRVLGRSGIGLDDICAAVLPEAEWIELPPGRMPRWLDVPDP